MILLLIIYIYIYQIATYNCTSTGKSTTTTCTCIRTYSVPLVLVLLLVPSTSPARAAAAANQLAMLASYIVPREVYGDSAQFTKEGDKFTRAAAGLSALSNQRSYLSIAVNFGTWGSGFVARLSLAYRFTDIFGSGIAVNCRAWCVRFPVSRSRDTKTGDNHSTAPRSEIRVQGIIVGFRV